MVDLKEYLERCSRCIEYSRDQLPRDISDARNTYDYAYYCGQLDMIKQILRRLSFSSPVENE